MVKPFRMMALASVLLLNNRWGVHAVFAQDLPEAQAEKRAGIKYNVTIKPTADEDVNTGMDAASSLKALQKTKDIGPYALAGRVRNDYDRVNGALRSRGYYAGHITIQLSAEGKTLEGLSPQLPSFLEHVSQEKEVEIKISAELGPQFKIGKIFFAAPQEGKASSILFSKQISLTEDEKKVFHIRSGDPAVAADILGVSGQLLTYLQEQGYAQARVDTPQATLNMDTKTVDVGFLLNRGPKVVIGDITFKGLERVRVNYVQRHLTLQEGQLYQPSAIEAARTDLGGTGLFSSVHVQKGMSVQPISLDKSHVAGVGDAIPLNFDFQEGKRRRVTGDVGYSTDLGGRLGASWLHRNLFGQGERLRLGVMATGLGGTAQQGLGYDVYADFTKPDFMQRDRTLHFRLEAVRQLLYSYHQTAILAQGGVTQPIGKDWFFSGAVSVEKERIRQFGTTRDYFIGSVPLQISYDSTHRSSPLDAATHGVRVALGITPSLSLGHQTSVFVPMNAQVATYFDLHHLGISKPGNSIIALRGAVGSIQGASTWNIPPDQRFYAGGPATVRGFRYQGVGPQYGNTKYAIGGTSMDAGTVEYRQKLPKNLGFVMFADAGQVGTSSMPGHGKLRIGYGGGVRYFTPIGPVRVDVALPMNRPYRGDKWELYFGLGETF